MKIRVASCALIASALFGCSSSTTETPSDGRTVGDGSPQRFIPEEIITRKAVAYSGYRWNQGPVTQDYPTEAQIKEDMLLLVRGGWTFIRLFDCSTHAERVLKMIRENALDIKVMAGVWIAGPKAGHDAQNRDQIEKCVTLAHDYSDTIVAVSVGNETLDDWSSVRTPVADLVSYIHEVRGRVPQPVTTDDMYIPFMFGMSGTTSYADVVEVAKGIDFMSIHAYAYIDAPWSWDWKQLGVPEGHARAAAMMNAAMAYTQACIKNVRKALADKGLDRPIVIGEAGWKSVNGNMADKDASFRAHPVNEKIFYDAFTSWIYGSTKDSNSPRTAFYFEAFDEPWKGEDDNWGLFDRDRKAKYVLWDAFPDLKPADAPTYSETDAVYYKAPPPALDAGPDASDAGTSDALVSDAVAPDGWAAGDAGTPDAASDRSPE